MSNGDKTKLFSVTIADCEIQTFEPQRRLGNDEHGKNMMAAYRARVIELRRIMYGADHA